jgi:hypothetical protein
VVKTFIYTGCPTRYRTRHFFNNSNTNEDIAMKFEQEYVRCVRNEAECVCSVCLFRCNIFIGVRISKEMPGSIASGTTCIFCMQASVYANILLNTCNKTAHARPKMLLSSLQSYHIHTTTPCPYRFWCPHSLLLCSYEESSNPSSRIKRMRREAVHILSSISDVLRHQGLEHMPQMHHSL